MRSQLVKRSVFKVKDRSGKLSYRRRLKEVHSESSYEISYGRPKTAVSGGWESLMRLLFLCWALIKFNSLCCDVRDVFPSLHTSAAYAFWQIHSITCWQNRLEFDWPCKRHLKLLFDFNYCPFIPLMQLKLCT